MRFRYMFEIAGFKIKMGGADIVRASLERPLPIEFQLTLTTPTSCEAKEKQSVFCLSETEGQFTAPDSLDLIRKAMSASVDGTWINLRDFPKESVAQISDEVERYMSPLRDTANRFFKLLRWRSGIEDGFTSYAGRELLSEDGEKWFEVAFGRSAILELRQERQWPSEIIESAKELYQNGFAEPLSHQLLREARSLRSSNPRAALVIGVAAAEIGVKRLVAFLVPHAQWLVDELQNPPFTKMLRKYLPSLPVKKHFTGKMLSPPNELIKVLECAAEARNKVVHAGGGPPSYTELGEMLDAIEDLLWICELYSGHAWSVEFISHATKSKWKSA